MLTHRQLFLQNVAQTSDFPLMLEIESAEGMYLYDKKGKSYMDLIAGVSVSNLGHRHPATVEAVKKQVDAYMHLMVYGEYIESPQVLLAKMLADNLDERLDTTYFVNSGTEATEGALKLAKRYTHRSEIVAFRNAYHGSTHGSMSLMSDDSMKGPFQPLLQDIKFLGFNSFDDLDKISSQTACVIIEPVQGEAGVIPPLEGFLNA